jgi:hypothetical protein
MQRKHFKFFISVVFVLLAASSFGQKSEKQIGLGTGWYYHSFKDASVSSTSQTGGSMSLLLFYRANGLKNRHHVQMVYAAPRLQSNYLLAREQTGYLQYAYHRKIGELKDISFFGGVVIEYTGSDRRYSEISNSVSYSNPFRNGELLATLSPSLLLEKSLGKDRVGVQGWANLIGLVSINDPILKDGVFAGSDLSGLEIRASYARFFSERWKCRLDYQFQLRKLNYQFQNYSPTNFSSSFHQVNFSLVYKFH